MIVGEGNEYISWVCVCQGGGATNAPAEDEGTRILWGFGSCVWRMGKKGSEKREKTENEEKGKSGEPRSPVS